MIMIMVKRKVKWGRRREREARRGESIGNNVK